MSLCEKCKRCNYADEKFAVCGGKMVEPRTACADFERKRPLGEEKVGK